MDGVANEAPKTEWQRNVKVKAKAKVGVGTRTRKGEGSQWKQQGDFWGEMRVSVAVR